jgi:putative transposase
MTYDPTRYHRRSIRLAGYDYSREGAYFITICSAGRACIFGQICDGRMQLSSAGAIVNEEWHRSAEIRRELRLDAFVVMPNHIHGIVFVIAPSVGAHGGAPSGGAPVPHPSLLDGRRPRSLGSFVAGFKSATTSRINAERGTPGEPIWQRNYYDHIVRNAADLGRIRRYIAANPARWSMDRENPDREADDPFDAWLESS